jgi:dihydrofolate reductase
VSAAQESEKNRKVLAQVSLSMDGFTSGPGGPDHDTWLYEHALQEQTAVHYEGIWRGVDTVLMGRTNYEGFFSVWPAMTRDPSIDPRTRALGAWLDSVEKVVFSHTLKKADWENSRISEDPEAEVEALKSRPGRDILVLNSASIIQTLLRADLINGLSLTVIPAVVGGGLRLFPDGLPASKWDLVESSTFGHGAVWLEYRRAEDVPAG